MEVSIIKQIDVDFGTLALRSDDILTFEPRPGLETVNLEQLKIMLVALIELCDGKPKPFLSNNKGVKSFGYEERAYVGKMMHQFSSATAVIESSPVIRFISYTIVSIFKPEIPVKLFKTKEEAFAWLQNFNTN